MHRSLPALVLLAGLATPASAQDIGLKSELTRWRITAEHFEVSGKENLALLGVHFDVLEPFRKYPALYAGVGGYGAVRGNRGGLLVGGLTVGWRQELFPGWTADLGYFVGGGGGGGGPENDGLMLRPHLAVERAVGLMNLRLEIAQTDLVGGDIDSTHLVVGTSLPSEILTAGTAARSRLIPRKALIKRTVRVTPLFTRLDTSSSKRRSGGKLTDDIGLVGAELAYFADDNWYFPLQVHGAIDGNVDGFAAGLAGIGAEFGGLGGEMHVGGKLLAGSGGGGDVDTGGGLLWGAQVDVRGNVAMGLEATLGIGLLESLDGGLDATTFTAGLGWSSTGTELSLDYPRSRLVREGIDGRDAEIKTTRFLVLNKSYSPKGGARKKNGDDYTSTLQLMGVGMEHPLGSYGLLVTGRLFGAWDGNAGGYAEALGGLKWQYSPFEDGRHTLHLQVAAGAAGGGGADVGSGLIYDYLAGYRMQFSKSASLFVDAGRVESNEGTFDATLYQLGLSWDLSRAFFK
jgi:hypothetical protein